MKTFKLLLFRYISPILLLLTFFIPFISYWDTPVNSEAGLEIMYYSPLNFLGAGSYFSVLSAIYLVSIGGYFALGITIKNSKVKQIGRMVAFSISLVMYLVMFGLLCTFNMNVYGWLLQVLMFLIFILNALNLWVIKIED